MPKELNKDALIQSLSNLLIKHEGLRLKPYLDSVGKLTIAVGRNLDDNGIRHVEAIMMLENDIDEVLTSLEPLDFYARCNNARRLVLADMCFNMGLPRLLGFKKMIAALRSGNWYLAAKEMLDSKWAGQVGKRALYLSDIMREGKL